MPSYESKELENTEELLRTVEWRKRWKIVIDLHDGYTCIIVGHGGALVESTAFNRRVVGSTPALAAT